MTFDIETFESLAEWIQGEIEDLGGRLDPDYRLTEDSGADRHGTHEWVLARLDDSWRADVMRYVLVGVSPAGSDQSMSVDLWCAAQYAQQTPNYTRRLVHREVVPVSEPPRLADWLVRAVDFAEAITELEMTSTIPYRQHLRRRRRRQS